MRRRDPIFWTATAIFFLSILLGSTVHESGFLLMAFSYLLRPTLHALGIAKRYADERQLTNQYRSGNIAFFVVIVGLIAVAAYAQTHGEHADTYVGLLCVGIAAKALAHILMSRDLRPTGITIVMTVGALMILFGAMEGISVDTLVHSIPGLILISIGALGFRYPKIAGLLTAVAACAAFYFFKFYLARQIPAFLLIDVPLFVAAGCLYVGGREGSDDIAPA